MTCYHPLKAYRSRERNPSTGRYSITFNPLKNLVEGLTLSLPCGRCIGCRIDKSRQWAMRCMHESQMHPENSFITLTYSDEHVPQDYSVKLRDLQLFMKRLRKSSGAKKIRFFASGEYGERTLRPHYHALLFNYDFADKKLFTVRNGNQIFKSDLLDELWPYGTLNEIGAVTYQSAAYVARYVIKKQVGSGADDHYARVSPVDGAVYNVSPEFCVMSRRPGIGATWVQKFKTDVFPSDFLIVDGKKHKPPTFYIKQLKEEHQTKVQRTRKRGAVKQKPNSTPERLKVREEVQQSRLSRLKRML